MTWVKFKWGKAWHLQQPNGCLYCSFPVEGKQVQYKRVLPASDGNLCKKCFYMLSLSFPENLLGFEWSMQPTEEELRAAGCTVKGKRRKQ